MLVLDVYQTVSDNKMKEKHLMQQFPICLSDIMRFFKPVTKLSAELFSFQTCDTLMAICLNFLPKIVGILVISVCLEKAIGILNGYR